MERAEVEERVRRTFDTVADSYDHPGSSWFDHTARAIAAEAQLAPGMEALDLATGTGKVALALAASQPAAKIIGIDLSEGMLAQARRKADMLGLKNLAFEQASFDSLDYGARFDVVTCSFGVFFVSHMAEVLTRFGAQTKSGGRVIVSTFGIGSFSPFNDAFIRLYREYGFEVPPPPWLRIATPELLVGLFNEAGMSEPEVKEYDFSFDLVDKMAWWDIVFNAGYRGMLQQLSAADAITFKDRHLAEVEELMSVQGLRRLNVRVLIGVGKRS